MRIFGIRNGDEFTEYPKMPFQDEHSESVLEGWLESNPDSILEDSGILITGRQLSTNLGGQIDLLGVDREGNVVVVELKRDRTPRDTIAQALEYASFGARLDADELERTLRKHENDESLSLEERHREYFEMGETEAVSFNKDQRIVVVGQNITPQIRQTAAYLGSKGIKATCVEFSFFQNNEGSRLLTHDIVVGKDTDRPVQVASASQPRTTEDAFLESCDDNGRAVFSSILSMAKKNSMPIHWGTRGFSANVELSGTRVPVCAAYPPNSSYKQTLFTRRGSLERKTLVPKHTIQSLLDQAEATGLFERTGIGLKCNVSRELTTAEINSITEWCESVAEAIRKHGLKEPEDITS